jgi:hypothetical protein
MIILDSKTLLELADEQEDGTYYVHGYIIYAVDGFRYDIGRVKKGEGSFLYDKQYVYRWRLNDEYPHAYNIEERREELSKEKTMKLINHYRSFI